MSISIKNDCTDNKVPSFEPSKEQGAALVMALIMLVVLTMIGVSGMRSAITDFSISQRFYEYDNAFQTAETGLRIAEDIIKSANSESQAQTLLTNENISFSASDSGDYSTNDFWNNINFLTAPNNLKVVVEKHYTVIDSIDMSQPGSTTTYYKITARGIDSEYREFLQNSAENMNIARGVIILQSIYAKRFLN